MSTARYNADRLHELMEQAQQAEKDGDDDLCEELRNEIHDFKDDNHYDRKYLNRLWYELG